jgi:uncharacterized Zn-binding protein involved in type VI secretion
MGQPAAKQGDQVTALDIHIVLVPAPPAPPIPTPLPHMFQGVLNGALSADVNIMGMPAATVTSTADNMPPHFPTPPGTAFVIPPTNRAIIQVGSPTVFINGKPAARNGDVALTCNDPVPLPSGTVIAVSTVMIG